MSTTIGSTDRLDVWRDLIREHFVALDIQADRDSGFAGTVRTAALGHLKVAAVASRTQGCHRTPGLARQDDQVYLQVGLVTDGEALLRQDGRDALLRPGQFAVYETDRPFFWGLTGDWELLVFTWPRSTMSLTAGESPELTARAFGGANGLGGIVSRMLRDLVMAPPELTPAGAVRLAYQVGEMVTTVAAEQVDPHPTTSALRDRLRQIDAYIAEHLGDPDLDPPAVARAHFMSTRQLHRLFAQSDDTVAQHIRCQRLERGRHDLADPRSRDHSITDIALRWGFPDLASFSRAFRARYGLSPSDYRRTRNAIGR